MLRSSTRLLLSLCALASLTACISNGTHQPASAWSNMYTTDMRTAHSPASMANAITAPVAMKTLIRPGIY